MPKPDAPPISLADIQEYLTTASDFSFEMSVLQRLTALHFECQHSGTYRDPVTEKARQFDIRASRKDGTFVLRLAVECKNLRDTSPLLIHNTARTAEESYHCLLGRKRQGALFSELIKVEPPESPYRPTEYVGRATDQVTRKGDNSFLASDSQVYEKVFQAVNGTFDLVGAAVWAHGLPQIAAILPILVIPDGRLWVCDYDATGTVIAGPEQRTSAPVVLGHVWDVKHEYGTHRFSLSHLEVVTLSALDERLQALSGPSGLFQKAARHWVGQNAG